jgi:DNA invertase Pin-like site-specific DNA recombinase
MDPKTELSWAAGQLASARSQVDQATEIAKGAARKAHANGVYETTISDTLHVSRMTVRRWLGKQ